MVFEEVPEVDQLGIAEVLDAIMDPSQTARCLQALKRIIRFATDGANNIQILQEEDALDTVNICTNKVARDSPIKLLCEAFAAVMQCARNIKQQSDEEINRLKGVVDGRNQVELGEAGDKDLQLNKLKKEGMEKDLRIEELNKEIQTLTDRGNSGGDEESFQLRGQVEDLKKKLNDKQKEIDSLKHDIDLKEDEADLARNDVEEANMKFNSLKEDYDRQKNEKEEIEEKMRELKYEPS
ncbi:MAG: hypothetical protein EZS28_014300 [Streblomastix strix]|uniref:Uncharacterized protein n=1 Tax=Streblomastix strix TaxID=222440 RepID=A0A5J4W636_9EUKA|nr:MAG: hypothetical protein EZS28_014300 [Streblomastix strix]